MPSILFVCTGNRCRSPFAAAVFRRCLEQIPDCNDWRVGSAGTWTEAGMPADPRMVNDARKLGIEMKSHRSRPVSQDLLAKSDLVLVMEAGQQEALQVEFPGQREKIQLLSTVVDEMSYDVPDTFGAGEEIDQDVAREITSLIERGFGKICELARANSGKPA